jgi:hypothetical protein
VEIEGIIVNQYNGRIIVLTDTEVNVKVKFERDVTLNKRVKITLNDKKVITELKYI